MIKWENSTTQLQKPGGSLTNRVDQIKDRILELRDKIEEFDHSKIILKKFK